MKKTTKIILVVSIAIALLIAVYFLLKNKLKDNGDGTKYHPKWGNITFGEYLQKMYAYLSNPQDETGKKMGCKH